MNYEVTDYGGNFFTTWRAAYEYAQRLATATGRRYRVHRGPLTRRWIWSPW